MSRNVVITGANRGIGRAMVQAFAEAGDNLWACARKPSVEFENDMAELAASAGVSIQPVYFDLLDEADVQRGMQRILQEKRPLDVLINNAGIPHGGLMMMTPLKTLREVYQVNVFAQVQMMQLAGRQMMRQKRGCVINICSAGGIEAEPGYLAYGSSKAALAWITRMAAKEWGAYGIRVNGIAPGLIDTDMGAYKPDGEREKMLKRMSIQRAGRPEEVASAALYIASDQAAFMTGHILVLDGGRV